MLTALKMELMLLLLLPGEVISGPEISQQITRTGPGSCEVGEAN